MADTVPSRGRLCELCQAYALQEGCKGHHSGAQGLSSSSDPLGMPGRPRTRRDDSCSIMEALLKEKKSTSMQI